MTTNVEKVCRRISETPWRGSIDDACALLRSQAQRIAELEGKNTLLGSAMDKLRINHSAEIRAAEAKLAAQPSSTPLDGEVVERVKRDIASNDAYSDDYRTDEILVSKADLRYLLDRAGVKS